MQALRNLIEIARFVVGVKTVTNTFEVKPL